MANYTIKLGDILTNLMLQSEYKSALELANLKPYSYETDPYKVVEKTREKFFDFNYPIHNEEIKKRLENKLLTHYYNYEICVDMPQHFKFLFKNTLNEIMPYYNALYKAIEKDFDPLINMEYEESVSGSGTNKASNNSRNNLDSKTTDEYSDTNDDTSKESDTPQGQIQDINDGKYLSKYTRNEGKSEGEKENNIHSTTELTQSNSGNYDNKTNRKISGIDGKSKSELLIEYTKAIQNVDLQIINSKEIASLFMQIW